MQHKSNIISSLATAITFAPESWTTPDRLPKPDSCYLYVARSCLHFCLQPIDQSSQSNPVYEVITRSVIVYRGRAFMMFHVDHLSSSAEVSLRNRKLLFREGSLMLCPRDSWSLTLWAFWGMWWATRFVFWLVMQVSLKVPTCLYLCRFIVSLSNLVMRLHTSLRAVFTEGNVCWKWPFQREAASFKETLSFEILREYKRQITGAKCSSPFYTLLPQRIYYKEPFSWINTILLFW